MGEQYHVRRSARLRDASGSWQAEVVRRAAHGAALTALLAAAGCASGRNEQVRRTDAHTADELDAASTTLDAGATPGQDAALTGADAPSADATSLDASGTDTSIAAADAPSGECSSGAREPCTTSCGSIGSRACTAGRWGTCAVPSESCNALDDDCDGSVDDGLGCARDRTETCTTTCGSTGLRTCSASCSWGTCVPPTTETCDGRDDDCDGTIDDGAPCGADETCAGGSCRRTRWVFEAERDLAHGFGRADGDGWSAATGPDARGVMLYGPYTREIPAGAATATFRLMVDNRSADNGVVVRLEVNDFDGASPDCGDCVIASREVRRMEWSAPMTHQDFSVPFSASAGHRLELRVYWTDISYVRVDRVVVTAP